MSNADMYRPSTVKNYNIHSTHKHQINVKEIRKYVNYEAMKFTNDCLLIVLFSVQQCFVYNSLRPCIRIRMYTGM